MSLPLHFFVFPLRSGGQRVHPLPELGTSCKSVFPSALTTTVNLNILVTVQGGLQCSPAFEGKRRKEEWSMEAEVHSFAFRQVLYAAVTNKYGTLSVGLSAMSCILDKGLFSCLGSPQRHLILEWEPWFFCHDALTLTNIKITRNEFILSGFKIPY